MGKASSNKKVARAAGISSGRGYRPATPWGYFGVIALIVILGVAGTWISRDRRISQINANGTTPPTVGTTWYEGYGVYECGKFAPAITGASNPYGITTKSGSGVITIAPKVKSVAGKNATLGKFASAAGMTLNAAALKVPGGKLYTAGDSCQGKPGAVYVKEFAFVGDKKGQLYNGAKGQLPKLDPRNVPLQDSKLVTIAFVPSSEAGDIPPPPGYVNTNLQTAQAALSTSTSTTTPASSATTTPASSATTLAPTTTSKP
jgi:hypothetical protein